MNHIETMKLALDHSEPSILSPGWTLVRNEDIAALREALAEQPEPVQQEPVAWYRDEDGIRIYYESKVWDDATPLYTSPPAQRKPLTTVTIADAPSCLNTNDKAMWVLGWNECVETHNIKGGT